jgi:hypothetical protein
MNTRIKIFEYVEQMDGFIASPAYHALADELGLTEWNPVVWIGRLFFMDNDFGEHWLDNWDIRESMRDKGTQLGYDVDTMFFLEPVRFQDGRDGPCHSDDFRTRFWTNVLQSLELDMTVLFDEARSFQNTLKDPIHAVPEGQDEIDEYVPDRESRIANIAVRYGLSG